MDGREPRVRRRTIDRAELKRKLDAGERLKLVMALGGFGFRAKRIPGSLGFDSPEEALAELEPEDEIVVYCAGESCAASVYAQRLLESRGYRNVRRYAGGIADWEAAGLPLEGELA
ncbi:MAG TPA: rhodanese-like domain-containing protein [Gaiellaceae bacterium]|nr:rhodanese-like domain-containing protein [Gaiellaceae bacterium]